MRTNKFILSLFTLLLVITQISIAQNSDKYTGSLLWKISGNNLNQPSYILGTHHLAHVSFVDSIAGLKKTLNDVDQIVGELVLDDMPALQTQMQQAALMPKGETYADLLTKDELQTLDAGLKSLFTVGLEQFGQLKPGMLSSLYTVTMYAKQHPEFNPMSHEAIDAYVQRIGKENGKSILGLETIDDQIYALFNAEPLKDQAKSLVCLTQNINTIEKLMDKLNEYYKTGNLAEMYNLSFNNPEDPCPTSAIAKSALSTDRNNKWLEKLPAIMNEKSNLIAVGALHLVGEDGLLIQLSNMGYTVEAVKE